MIRTTVLAFTYNRPMQCDLMLKTLKHCVKEYDDLDIKILYRYDEGSYLAHNKFIEDHPNIDVIKEENFASDVKRIINGSKSDFIFFITDDTIFTHQFSIKEIENLFDTDNDLFNFSLRLGENTQYCYPLNTPQFVPLHEDVDIFFWNWKYGSYDFGYCAEVSSSVFRKSDIEKMINAISFNNPNELEWFMHQSRNSLILRERSACYKTSVAFSAPMNKVNNQNKNRVANNLDYSAEKLFEKYLDGYRINPEPFYGMVSNAAHQEVEFEFVEKEES